MATLVIKVALAQPAFKARVVNQASAVALAFAVCVDLLVQKVKLVLEVK